MSLRDDFTFSQSSLQDFVDCPRRFELKYIDEVRYPALEAQPALEFEKRMRKGAHFHKMVEQYFAGVPADRLEQSVADDPELSQWWQDFMFEIARRLSTPIGVETTLQTMLGGYRLIAKYDAVMKSPNGHILIYDWKTAEDVYSRARLQHRMQTIVYPYVMAQAGSHFNDGEPIPPDHIHMVYRFRARAVTYDYSAEQMDKDEATLQKLIADIESASLFPLTDETNHCRFCTYRSLCNRGDAAGDWNTDTFYEDGGELEPVDNSSFDVDFDQIGEIEF